MRLVVEIRSISNDKNRFDCAVISTEKPKSIKNKIMYVIVNEVLRNEPIAFNLKYCFVPRNDEASRLNIDFLLSKNFTGI